MKIYFAGAIRGGRKDVLHYKKIIKYLEGLGSVLTEHVGNKKVNIEGEKSLNDVYIYKRDIQWLTSCNIVIAEVTIPSLGVGYELAFAEKINKPILCLFRNNNKTNLSAMINGNKKLNCKEYNNLSEAIIIINEFVKKEKQ